MATWKTDGTCSGEILFEVDNDIVTKVEFIGGCPGNALGLTNMVEGLHIDEVVKKLRGIKCGNKDTSCPDQLAMALISWKAEQG